MYYLLHFQLDLQHMILHLVQALYLVVLLDQWHQQQQLQVSMQVQQLQL